MRAGHFWIVVLPAASGNAQWLNHKTPGIPRLPDGKPDLSAPAPRMPDGKPDLSGLWRADTAGSTDTSKATDSVKPQPWAAELLQERKDNHRRETPAVLCLPQGRPLILASGKLSRRRTC